MLGSSAVVVPEVTRLRGRALGLLAVIVALSVLVVAARPAHAETTFTVNTTDGGTDSGCRPLASGDCTLREAIDAANAAANSGGPDVINFGIPGTGTKFIRPASELPTITQPVIIDGYTQTGAEENTETQPDKTNARPKIVLSGVNAAPDPIDPNSGVNGLTISGGGTTIRGLVINDFHHSGAGSEGGHGIFLLNVPGNTGNKIEGNFIGTDANGAAAVGNEGAGLFVGGPGSNTIGGTDAGDGAADGVVEARNLISGNRSGIALISPDNEVRGNLVGTNKTGLDSGVANTFGGISVSGSDNLVAGNTVAFNGSLGLGVFDTGNRILSNSIFSNGRLGIDLSGGTQDSNGVTANDPGDGDTGPNDLQNFPELGLAFNSGGSTTVQGTLNSTANSTFTVQFFSTATADPSGFGEGKTLLGTKSVSTNANGDASFSFIRTPAVPEGHFVTATATRSAGIRGTAATGTSEFSAATAVANVPPVADDDSYTTDEDTQLNVPAPGVLGGDTDANGDPVGVFDADPSTASTIDPVSGPSNGTLTLNQDGSFTYAPDADFSGTDSFTYKATDGSESGNTATVTIAVDPVNDAPTANNGTETMNEDGAPITIDLGALVSDVETSDSNLAYGIVSGPTAAQGALTGTGSTRTFDPADNFNGTVDITYTATDRGDPDNCGAVSTSCDGSETSEQKTVIVTVNPVNDAPSFTRGPNQTVAEDSGPRTVAGWATNISKGPANESSQTLSFLVSNDTSSLFSVQPKVSPSGTLSFTPKANAFGTATVTVRLKDSGGIANGGKDTSRAQSFAVAVTPVNDAPTITSLSPAPGSTTTDRTPTIEATVKDLETDLSEDDVKLFLDGQAVAASKFVYDAATDRLTFTPAVALGFGDHTAKIVATDAQGESATRQWGFKVAQP